MVREPDATLQPPPQDHQLMSKRRVLGFKPQPRLERRGQNGQHEIEQPDHLASLGDSNTSSTRTGFSVHARTASPRRAPLSISAPMTERAESSRHSSVRAACRPAVKHGSRVGRSSAPKRGPRLTSRFTLQRTRDASNDTVDTSPVAASRAGRLSGASIRPERRSIAERASDSSHTTSRSLPDW